MLPGSARTKTAQKVLWSVSDTPRRVNSRFNNNSQEIQKDALFNPKYDREMMASLE